jgi:hypothetical protein
MQRDLLVKKVPTCDTWEKHDEPCCWDAEPVTDAEVLEALGATRQWLCENTAIGECDEDRANVDPRLERKHSACRWVWIVEAGDGM